MPNDGLTVFVQIRNIMMLNLHEIGLFTHA